MQTENKTEKLHFKTVINASKQKVWDVLWGSETYPAWTSVFSEGSCAESNWEEGSEIIFSDGKGNGMYSVIERKIPAEYMSFKHLGDVKNEQRLPINTDENSWSGAMENYFLKETNGETELTVETDAIPSFINFMNENFPKAMQKIKELAETKTEITVETGINAPVEKVWQLWSLPEHITNWNNASDDWHTPWAKNDLKTGGKFTSRMEARDGSMGFEFEGIYDEVTPHEKIAYTMGDGRRVTVIFTGNGKSTKVVESFDAEETNSIELQRGGWQSILNNFKKYVEAN